MFIGRNFRTHIEGKEFLLPFGEIFHSLLSLINLLNIQTILSLPSYGYWGWRDYDTIFFSLSICFFFAPFSKDFPLLPKEFVMRVIYFRNFWHELFTPLFLAEYSTHNWTTNYCAWLIESLELSSQGIGNMLICSHKAIDVTPP